MGLQWDVRGWSRLNIHDDPPLIAAREEFLKWLDEVPEPHRLDLGRRLTSSLDDQHLSARLELFTHHHFITDGWSATIHPNLPHTENHPDFLFKREGQLIVECRSVFDQRVVARQEQALSRLADQVSRNLGVTVMLHPLEDLPSSLPARRIRAEIVRRVQEPTEVQELELRGVHQGSPYAIKALVFAGSPETELPAGVQGLAFQAQTVTIGAQIRDAAREKAGKYGVINLPFIIALSVETSFPSTTEHEVAALFGDKVWNVPSSGYVTESQKPNGLFTMTRDASPRYARVSGVLFYRFKWTEGGHQHLAHLYHNPHASIPVEPELFPEFPQLIQVDETKMRWINGKPEQY